MAFDGITVAAIVAELKEELNGTRINKIQQTESDELMLTMKGNSKTLRLCMSANASLPLLYLAGESKPAPLNAPAFCMLLRKHLNNARVVDITQPDFERVIDFTLEHLDEMGDICRKHLMVEIMGKHSNIIFVDDAGMILDSIKRISAGVSSVREVLPGREYFIPKTADKRNPLQMQSAEAIVERMELLPPDTDAAKLIFGAFTGISPAASYDCCAKAGVDPGKPGSSLSREELCSLSEEVFHLFQRIAAGSFAPEIYYENGSPKEYSMLPLSTFPEKRAFDSPSALIEYYYREKNASSRMKQKSVDLRKIVSTHLERNVKKLDLQDKQMKDANDRENDKLYGELLTAYAYSIVSGSKSAEVLNYYTNETVRIALDDTLSIPANAKKYYDRYTKKKRTSEALSVQMEETKSEIEHLSNVMNAIAIATSEEDLKAIKEELIDWGYIRRKPGEKKAKVVSKPWHYISRDGFDLYVGRNNYQNDELSFKMATGNDWWFHAKKTPGSHVILKTPVGMNPEEIPDATFEDAARLAAFYSTAKEQGKAEIDYLKKKDLKKPAGAKPGFVVYYTNFSMTVPTNIDGITEA